MTIRTADEHDPSRCKNLSDNRTIAFEQSAKTRNGRVPPFRSVMAQFYRRVANARLQVRVIRLGYGRE